MSSNDLIVFGDGQQALFYDEKNETLNRDFVKVIPVLVVPSIELKSKYNLTDETLPIVTDDGKRGIWMEYPKKWVKWLRKPKPGGVLLIFCAFDSSRTDFMYYYDELLDYCRQLDNTEARLRAQVSKLQRENENITSAQKEYFREQQEIRDIVSEGNEGDEEIV